MTEENNVIKNFAKGLQDLVNKKDLVKIEKGFFRKIPDIYGYYYYFSSLEKPNIYIIINENNNYVYNKEFTKVNSYLFIVFNCSINEFFNNLENNILEILKISKKFLSEEIEEIEQSKGGLPYGYYKDKEGNIKVDLKQASEIRSIFDLYLNGKSIREIADALHTNFSKIRDILADDRYYKMKKSIIPQNKIKKAKRLTDYNRKNRYDKERTKSLKLKDLRDITKDKLKNSNSNLEGK